MNPFEKPIEKEEIFLEEEQCFNEILLQNEESVEKQNKIFKKTTNLEKTFEISLTYEQYHVIKMNLPKGYSLKEKKKKKKMSFSMTSSIKKAHFEQKPSFSKPIQPPKTSFPLQTEPISFITPPQRPITSESSLLNQQIPDQEWRKISFALKNFKIANETLKKCYKLLLILKIHPKIKPFMGPVDYVALKIPDYPQIIKEPMDLGIIEKKILGEVYKSQAEFEADVQKIWNNSILYNPKNTKIYSVTIELKDYFERLLIESQGGDRRKEGMNIEKKIDKLLANIENMYKKDQSNFYLVFKNKMRKLANIPMNLNDRKTLSENLMKISKVELTGVLDIINEGDSQKYKEKNQIELDLNLLNNEKLRMLEGYVEFIEKNKKQRNEDKEKKKQRDETNKVFFLCFLMFFINSSFFFLRRRQQIQKILKKKTRKKRFLQRIPPL